MGKKVVSNRTISSRDPRHKALASVLPKVATLRFIAASNDVEEGFSFSAESILQCHNDDNDSLFFCLTLQ